MTLYELIDIHVDAPSVETQKLAQSSKLKSQSSKEIQKRVQTARNIQSKRFKVQSASRWIRSNSEMTTKDVKEYCPLSTECRTMLISAVASMSLTARSYFKVIKISRTIADLAGEKEITAIHLAEALQYRPKQDDY